MTAWDLVILLCVFQPILFCFGVWLGRILEREQTRMDTETVGGYSSSDRLVTDLPLPPRGPAPGSKTR